MIEITEVFTSITAGVDPVGEPPWRGKGDSREPSRHPPTGARVTLEFSRDEALPPGQPVRVRYQFGGDQTMRETVGIAVPTHTTVRWGRAVVFHYRLSHWIAPGALMMPIAADNVRQLGDQMPGEAPTAARRVANGGAESRGDLIRA